MSRDVDGAMTTKAPTTTTTRLKADEAAASCFFFEAVALCARPWPAARQRPLPFARGSGPPRGRARCRFAEFAEGSLRRDRARGDGGADGFQRQRRLGRSFGRYSKRGFGNDVGGIPS